MRKRYAGNEAANLIDGALRRSPRPAREVAAEVGLVPNLLSMIRTGETALPVPRCRPLAKALGIEPASLMAACCFGYPGHRAWQAVALAVTGPVR